MATTGVAARYLGQTLIVAPDVPFSEIESVMARLGWQREAGGASGQPLVAGEPELASFSASGHKPIVTYTFNPVAELRVLDVATVPPAARGLIADCLPTLGEQDVERLFAHADARRRLLGLWAARETERIDLIGAAVRLQQDDEAAVARAAADVAAGLERVADARVEVFAKLSLLADAAGALVRRLADPAAVLELRPDREDLVDLFDEEVGTLLFERLESRTPATAPRIASSATVAVTAAPAGLLRWSNELSDRFPLGYRDIAGWMNARRVWLTWTVTAGAGTGACRYDGLAWLGERWVWLPKAYRDVAAVLGPLLDRDIARH